jgi:hypothetical protein
MPRRLTTDEFVQKANKKHDGYYTYNKTDDFGIDDWSKYFTWFEVPC